MVKIMCFAGQFRITIPKELVWERGWKRGTILRFVELPGGDVLLREVKPAKARRKAALLPILLCLLLLLPHQALADCFDPIHGLTRAEAIVRQNRAFEEFSQKLRGLGLAQSEIDQVIDLEFHQEYSRLVRAVLEELAETGYVPIKTDHLLQTSQREIPDKAIATG